MKINNINRGFLNEYKVFIIEKLLPFLGIEDNNVEDYDENQRLYTVFFTDYISQDHEYLYFGMKNDILFRLKRKQIVDLESIKVSRCILGYFLKVSAYQSQTSSPKKTYLSDIHREKNYDYAIQNGLCEWIIGNNDINKFEQLFGILENWSLKTYEGKKVSFGLVINPEYKKNSNRNSKYGNFLSFLGDEFSAVLTDGISSVIELDSDCDIIGFNSIYSNGNCDRVELINNLPYRFAPTIARFVTDKKIGIFLLNNGDIILSKNQKIEFVKRNGRWLNFNVTSFINSMSEFIEYNSISDELAHAIYNSALDVSFSHSGGIISLVTDVDSLRGKGGLKSILSECDDLSNGLSLLDVESILDDKLNNISKKNEEINKRILKRSILLSLLNGKEKFTSIDRKLRSELISMDGACIIGKNGQIYTFGAIIQNDSGSSGGGRGAAAKKLSNYGFSTKISTDGYIEVYQKGVKKHIIK